MLPPDLKTSVYSFFPLPLFPFPPSRVCEQFGPGGETVNPAGLMINMGIQNQNYSINNLQIEIQYFCFEK